MGVVVQLGNGVDAVAVAVDVEGREEGRQLGMSPAVSEPWIL